MEKEYVPFSRPPFEGDKLIGEKIKQLCREYDISAIIETGTQTGSTARELYRLTGIPVVTIEHDSKWFTPVSKALTDPDSGDIVHPRYGLSTWWIERLVGPRNNVLFYLDAHNMDGTPIQGELKLIGKLYKDSVVVVHDCQVPDHPEFGFDKYSDGTILSYDYFKESITWPHIVNYNSKAEGLMRGVCYITPKE